MEYPNFGNLSPANCQRWGAMIVEGIRDGLAWSMTIDQISGKMVLTASGDAVGFVVFGACTAR